MSAKAVERWALTNPQCDGGRCVSAVGEVRVLPYSRDGNLLLCRRCYELEIEFRRERNVELGEQVYDVPAWENLKVCGEQ